MRYSDLCSYVHCNHCGGSGWIAKAISKTEYQRWQSQWNHQPRKVVRVKELPDGHMVPILDPRPIVKEWYPGMTSKVPCPNCGGDGWVTDPGIRDAPEPVSPEELARRQEEELARREKEDRERRRRGEEKENPDYSAELLVFVGCIVAISFILYNKYGYWGPELAVLFGIIGAFILARREGTERSYDSSVFPLCLTGIYFALVMLFVWTPRLSQAQSRISFLLIYVPCMIALWPVTSLLKKPLAEWSKHEREERHTEWGMDYQVLEYCLYLVVAGGIPASASILFGNFGPIVAFFLAGVSSLGVLNTCSIAYERRRYPKWFSNLIAFSVFVYALLLITALWLAWKQSGIAWGISCLLILAGAPIVAYFMGRLLAARQAQVLTRN